MYPYFKRSFDFTISLIGLIAISPLLSVISILVLVYHGRPILFTQLRPGKNERIFKMFKFRTMTNKKDTYGKLLPDEQRLTSFGKFLRKTSLDELPELFNVMKGDMSLVGPRPLLNKYLPYYSKREKKRHLVKPGITGLAQVSGRNCIDWSQRLELDVQYVEHMSFSMDIKILIKTVWVVLFSRGVSVDSAKVEPSFIDYRKNQFIKR